MIEKEKKLKKLNSWRLPGVAKLFARPENEFSLRKLLVEYSVRERIFFLGLGSNILLPDGVFDALVIQTTSCLDFSYRKDEDSTTVQVEIGAGVTCAKASKLSLKFNFVGGEFFAGVYHGSC